MKITIDTENKIISLNQSISLAELITTIEKLLPNDEWKEYIIITTIVRPTPISAPGNWNDLVQPNTTYTYEPPFYTTCSK